MEQPSGWCSMSAGRSLESARHGPMRCYGRDYGFRLIDLARAKGSLCGWGCRLWRWGTMLGESHGSCPLGS
ncbi:hypothetical protein ACFX1Q_032957 [Malus domestica]